MADTNYSALTEVNETGLSDDDLFFFRDVSASAGPPGFRVIPKVALAAALASSGANGWTAVHALVSDGDRRVLQLVDYVGGTGTKPTANLNSYVGSSGYVNSIAAAVDLRGAPGSGGGGGGGSSEPSPLEMAVASDKRDANTSGGYVQSGVWVSRPLSEVSFATSNLLEVVAPKTFSAINNSNTLSSINTNGLVVGMQIYENSGGNGIPPGTTISAIGSNQVTLSANYTGSTGSGKTARFAAFKVSGSGEYDISWAFDAVGIGSAITRLIDLSGGSEVARGNNGYSASDSVSLTGSGKVTVTTSGTYEVQMRTTAANGDNAMGQLTNFGSGQSNVFGRVSVTRLFAPVSASGSDQVSGLDSPATRTQNTYDAIPQMTFPLLAGKKYAFQLKGFFSASGTGNGIGLKVLGPDGSSGHVGYQISTNGTGGTSYRWLSGSMAAAAGNAIGFNTTASAGSNQTPFEINGIITTTNSGNFSFQFRSENTSPAFVQILPGAVGRISLLE